MFKTTNIQPITKDLLETVRQAVKEQNENKHYETAIIIDLETLGRTNDAVVFNLAALFFSLNPDKQESLEQEEPNNSLNLRFDVLEQIALGNKLDFSTAEFWSNTKNKLALETITKLPLSNFKESMEELNKWVRNLKVKYGCRVHHRGMDFDGPILDNLYKAAGIKKEWIRGDATRDIRSYIDALLKTNTGYVPGIGKESIEITHTALGDCYNDARAMQIAYKLNKDNTCDNELVAAATIMHDLELKFKEFESIVTTLLLFRGINEIGPHIKDKDISYILTDRNEDSFTIHAKHDNGKTVEVIIEHG